MGYVVKAYDLKFVVNISELGEDDPLMQNVSPLCIFSIYSEICFQ